MKPGDTHADLGSDKGSGRWVALPSAGKGKSVSDDGRRAVEPAVPRPELQPESVVSAAPLAGSGKPVKNGSARSTPGAERSANPIEPDAAARDRVESVPHRVERGENFWTISQLYYGSGRFYKALAAANGRTGSAITQLYVGQTVRIPPPESLDRRLIDPPRTRGSGGSEGTASGTPVRPATSQPATGRKPGEIGLALPVSDPFARRKAAEGEADRDDPAAGQVQRPRRPKYRVHANETLRSIARDTLGDSRRADEILDLNPDAIDDPNHLIPGQVIELPADAKVLTAPPRRTRERDDDTDR